MCIKSVYFGEGNLNKKEKKNQLNISTSPAFTSKFVWEYIVDHIKVTLIVIFLDVGLTRWDTWFFFAYLSHPEHLCLHTLAGLFLGIILAQVIF